MRKPSQVFVHVEPGKSQNVSTDSVQIQSTNAFKPSCVRAGKLGKTILLLTTFFICGLVPFSLSASVVPVGVSASDGEFQDIIRLTWEDVADETSYQVFRCDSDISASCGSATELPADTIQFDDIGNEIVGGYHYYRVKSCIDAVCSDFSATDSGYTQLMFGSGLEADTIAVTSFTINDVSNITLLPLDTANLDWSTGNAQDCVATSSPNLDVWNQAISISTYGPKTISLSADTAGGTYVLDLSCMSALGMEAGKQVILTVTTEPEAPALIDALGLDKRAVLVFSARGDRRLSHNWLHGKMWCFLQYRGSLSNKRGWADQRYRVFLLGDCNQRNWRQLTLHCCTRNTNDCTGCACPELCSSGC